MDDKDAEKLPLHLQKQEERLKSALHDLRTAYGEAIDVEKQLTAVLQKAKDLLDANNY